MSECKCIENLDANQKMVDSNTEILKGMLGPSRAYISTTKRDDKKRGNPLYVQAAYCPFCGVKYPKTDRMGISLETEDQLSCGVA